MKIGFNVNHANAGKKCIGITIPGNNSGESTVSGRLTAKGPKMLAKESITNRKLKTISPVVFSHLSNSQKPIAASIAPNRLAEIIFTGFTISMKSEPNECAYTFWKMTETMPDNNPEITPSNKDFLNISLDLFFYNRYGNS